MFSKSLRRTIRPLQHTPKHRFNIQPDERNFSYTIFSCMLRASQPILNKIYAHPFPMGLSDGTLPVDNFRQYMRQDALYLDAFAELFMHLEKHSKIETTDQTLLTKIRRNTVQQERTSAYSPGSGPTIFSNTASFTCNRSPVITEYLAFLQQKAHHEPPALSLTSLLPCFVIYKNLGLLMRPVCQDDLPFAYREWIQSCSGESYHASTDAMINLVEKYAKLSPALRKPMIDAFKTAAQFELAFFEECLPTPELQTHARPSLSLSAGFSGK